MQVPELCKRLLVQLPEHLLIVQTRVVAAVLGNTVDVGALKVLQHRLHIILGHPCAVVTDDRAEIQELPKSDFIAARGGILLADLRGVCKYFQCPVRSEVEHIAVLLAEAVEGRVWSLDPEDGLHIGLRVCAVRAGQHHYGSPRLHRDAGRKLSAGQGNRSRLFRILAHRLFHERKCVVVFNFFVPVSGYVHDFELPENRMLLEQCGESLRLLDSGNNPERVSETIAELQSREWIARGRIIFHDKVKKVFHILLVNEPSFHPFRHRFEVASLVSGPGAEEFLEVERLVLRV